MDKMILTSETDMYAFFEIIDRTEAESILDVGMFLKRIGAVSRQVKDRQIPMEKNLTGVDFFPETECPVWNTVYDSICCSNEIFLPENHKTYELAMVLQLEHCVDREESVQMWKWLSSHVSYIMTDWKIEDIRNLIKYKTDTEIIVDNKSYRFIIV